jgi:hypothetical protein
MVEPLALHLTVLTVVGFNRRHLLSVCDRFPFFFTHRPSLLIPSFLTAIRPDVSLVPEPHATIARSSLLLSTSFPPSPSVPPTAIVSRCGILSARPVVAVFDGLQESDPGYPSSFQEVGQLVRRPSGHLYKAGTYTLDRIARVRRARR